VVDYRLEVLLAMAIIRTFTPSQCTNL